MSNTRLQLRDLNPQRLRYFYEVVTSGSIRGAAEKLNTAASVVTRQIRLLEKELGVRLFERSVTGTVPTEAAQEVLGYWRALRLQHDDLTQRLKEIHDLSRGHVRIAAATGFVNNLLDEVIVPFSKIYPNVQFSLETLGVAEIVEAVADGTCQIGIAFNPPTSQRIEVIAEVDIPLRLIVGPQHALAGHRQPVTVQQALTHPLAVLTPTYGIRKILDLIAYTERVQMIPALTTNDLHIAIDYAKRTNVGTFLDSSHIGDEIANGDLFSVRVAHPLLEKGQGKLLVRAGHPLPNAARQINDWILKRSKIFARRP
jgi:DNA-binding transcriptional LysR family regulator